jgi:hypothetical protein
VRPRGPGNEDARFTGITARVLLRPALALASRFSRMLSFQIKDMEFTADNRLRHF